ncbi:MAG: hypothetical protein EBU26_13610 [Verrucomicrobia bacterium]|nr:hypothetical protein [Verrucomicrobiota bacterium]
MPRKPSQIAPDWWDYTTLDASLVREAAALTPRQLKGLSRPGFKVVFYDTLEDFYLAEALEYLDAWKNGKDLSPAKAVAALKAKVGEIPPQPKK